jgi:hypothetical protein
MLGANLVEAEDAGAARFLCEWLRDGLAEPQAPPAMTTALPQSILSKSPPLFTYPIL